MSARRSSAPRYPPGSTWRAPAALLVALGASVAAAAFLSRYTSRKRDPSAGSLGLRLRLLPRRSAVRAGEDVALTEELANTGSSIVYARFNSTFKTVWKVGSYRPPGTDNQDAADGQSEAPGGFVRHEPEFLVPDAETMPGFAFRTWTSQHFARPLGPGEKTGVSRTFRITAPGIYRFVSQWSSSEAAVRREPFFAGTLESSAAEIHVLP